MSVTQNEKAAFRALHCGPGAFVIPNPWDVGSARILAGLGFQALATSIQEAGFRDYFPIADDPRRNHSPKLALATAKHTAHS